jgi:DNA repair protein RecO
MVYETYETEGFVLSAKNAGEGNRIFSVLTKDFGLIQAVAQSVRSETSKLRYNLQVFSKTYVSVVKGREYFRIVGARDAEHFFVAFQNDPEKLRFVRRLFNLLLRLVQGEGENHYLFAVLANVVRALSENSYESAHLKQIELLTVVRILYALGYFSDKEKYAAFFENAELTPELVGLAQENERTLLFDVNQSLSESHL